MRATSSCVRTTCSTKLAYAIDTQPDNVMSGFMLEAVVDLPYPVAMLQPPPFESSSVFVLSAFVCLPR